MKFENLIIDSHLSHFLPKDLIDILIITRCELKELKKRLEKRKYSEQKVRENMDAEIFEICKTEAQELAPNIMETNTFENIDDEKICSIVDYYMNSPSL